MKVFIDTNVILDVLCNRVGFVEASDKVMKLCETNQIDGYVSALSFPNIVYIMRKELDHDKVQEVINALSMIFKVMDLKADDLKQAAVAEMKDYEDALQAVCAARIKAQYILTRNVRDFQGSPVPAILPADFLHILEQNISTN